MDLGYTTSIHYDRRLYKHDIAGSIAHAKMLSDQGIISNQDQRKIVDGLNTIIGEIENDDFRWREDLEDIHMNIENRLFEHIGDVAGKLHTGRSRNDQIALDMRMYTREVSTEVIKSICELRAVLVRKSDDNSSVVMPGYTHLQRAQPILFPHHMLAYFEMLGRDSDRFKQVFDSSDVMPLGSGALAGVTYPIDREKLANELNFTRISRNSMDAVSDRDFILDFHAAASTCMVHLSRLSEELVLWSTEEFGFIRLHTDYTTGSSMMPQKRNPDFAELARGKSGRVFGHLMALLTVLKGLPLTYDRDLQEDKEGLFDTVDVILHTLQIMAGMVSSMELNVARLQEATSNDQILATDIADYLVSKGMSFRKAHGIVGELVNHAFGEGIQLRQVSMEKYKQLSHLFEDDIFEITVFSSLEARNVPGGTASDQVSRAIAEAYTELENETSA